jgi:WD40 repeat protein
MCLCLIYGAPAPAHAQKPELVVQTGHDSVVYSLDVSQDSKYLLSGSSDRTLRVWHIQSGKEVRRFQEDSKGIHCVTFSPDGKYILSGSGDGALRLRDFQSGRIIKALRGHSDSVLCARFSPDGNYIISGSWDKTYRLWDVASGVEIRKLRLPFEAFCAAFSPDGKRIILGIGSEFGLFDSISGKQFNAFPGVPRGTFLWSPARTSSRRTPSIGTM